MLKIIKENISSKKHKPLSFLVNLLGMSLALTAVFIIYLHISSELNHDQEFFMGNDDHRNRIVRIEYPEEELGTIVPNALKLFADELPQIEASSLIMKIPGAFKPLDQNRETIKLQALLASQNITKILPFKVIYGDIDKAFKTKNSVIISRSAAVKLFGYEDVVGENLKFEGKIILLVDAVIDDMPDKTTYRGDIILHDRITEDLLSVSFDKDIMTWGYWNSDLLALLKPQVDIEEFNVVFEEALHTKREAMYGEEVDREPVLLRPYMDSYISAESTEYTHANNVSKKDLNLLGLISILILVIAIINFINIYIARSLDIIRKMGIRAIFGANRFTLSMSIIVDAIVTVFISSVLAYFLAYILMPIINQNIGFEIDMSPTPFSIITLFIIIPLFSGIIAGIYPAIILTKLKPLEAINKRAISIRHTYIRGILTILQFTISISLIISTLLINKQINYVLNMDTGYDKDNVFSVKSGLHMSGKTEMVRNRLLEAPNVIAVSFVEQTPVDLRNLTTIGVKDLDGNNITVHLLSGDEHTIDVLGIELIEGSPLNMKAVYQDTLDMVPHRLMNETLAKLVATYSGDSTLRYPFGGIMKNFNYRSATENIGPLIFQFGYGYESTGEVLIKISETNQEQTIDFIEKTFKEIFPDQIYEASFLDTHYDEVYESERILRFRLLFFSILAIVIASLGVFALVNFSVEKRRREIAIRKVYGSSTSEIIIILLKGISKWIIISFIIVVPLSIYIMNLWLNQYEYQTKLSAWIFIVACLGTALIAISTTLVQTYIAASRNPAAVVKSE